MSLDTPVTVTFVTIDSEAHAAALATVLVEQRLAACVNLLPAVRSIYRWEGAVCDDREVLLVIKSRQADFERLAAAIRQHHPYSVPEIISLPIVSGNPAYLDWLLDATAATK